MGVLRSCDQPIPGPFPAPPPSQGKGPGNEVDETWYADVTRQGDIKNEIKRGGHRACCHATMLTNTVIKVTFGDLRAQQIRAIIFQCGVLYYTEFDFLGLLIHLRRRKNGFKNPALLINIFIL